MIFRRRDNDGFRTFSFSRLLLSPFRLLGHWLGGVFEGDTSIQVAQSPTERVVGVITFPLRLCWGFMVFLVQAWASSRSGFAFIRAMPAIIVIIGFFGGLLVADWVVTNKRQVAVNSEYLAFNRSTFPDHPEYAKMFVDKLLDLKPESDEFKFQLGLTYEQLNDDVKAMDVMTFIAPDDRAGFADAHIWLSQHYYTLANAEPADGDRYAMVKKHLELANEKSPENTSGNFGLALVYIEEAKALESETSAWQDKLRMAAAQLTPVVRAEITGQQILILSQALPILIDLRLKLGEEQEATRLAKSEISRLEPVANSNPEIFEIRKTIVNCAVLTKDFQKAGELINTGLELAKSQDTRSKIFRLATAVYIAQADRLKNMQDRRQYELRLQRLSEAVAVNPTDRAACIRLLGYIGKPEPEGTTPPEVGAASTDPVSTDDFAKDEITSPIHARSIEERWLANLLVKTKKTATIHLLLGMDDISNGDISEGKKHWRIAGELYRSTNLLLNSLIAIAAEDQPERFSHLFDMMTLGIEMFPDEPLLYQTRGVFLKNQGRLEEAIKDFLFALESTPSEHVLQRLVVHKHLLLCYETMGNQDAVFDQQIELQQELGALGERDREIAEELLDRLK